MLRVQISINQDIIIDIQAQRVEGFKGAEHVHEYHACEVSEALGREYFGKIRHKYSSGGEELAIKLLRLYKKEVPR